MSPVTDSESDLDMPTREMPVPTDTDGEKIEYAPAGTICEAHNLYQSEPDREGLRSWIKEIPTDLVAPAENSESNQYALVVRHVKCYNGRRNLEVHSILVQSDLLKKFLAGVFEGYPGLTMTLDRVEFKSPFKPFVLRWEQLIKARDSVTDPETKSHVDLLYEVLNEELGSVLSRKKDLVKNGVITADLLYTIFEPGDTIIGAVEGRTRAFIFDSGSTDQCGVFVIRCRYVDYDGEGFGYTSDSSKIPPYEGTLPITSLPVFPLIYHKSESAIEEQLITRGKLWESYSGYHYKQYEGVGKGYFFGRVMKLHVKGRVVIDTESYNAFNEDESVSVTRSYLTMDDKKRMLATSALRGYALKEKKWLEFELDGLSDIVWDDRAFDSLVLPHGERDLKKLILAFARSQSKHSDSFDDVIKGKGRGVIMLLRGPPGVGKTLTAESVAEVMKVPLYVLSAGDLGTSASRVEDSLKDILSMVPRWGAVLLIDEADVFMEARDSTDLERNELVSIFLRLLEYYEGILFLTTNRAENIDPAFESRIHVSIRYPDLNQAARRQIWTQFISETDMDMISAEKLGKVSEMELNGRQIKNVIRTAHLLAQDEGCSLTFDHVQTVLNLREPERI